MTPARAEGGGGAIEGGGGTGNPPTCVGTAAGTFIAIGGDSLQLDSKLPAASVNILMAVVLLAVFGFTAKRKESVA